LTAINTELKKQAWRIRARLHGERKIIRICVCESGRPWES
jgi:hypothetical protein